jgi:hypothetical protein
MDDYTLGPQNDRGEFAVINPNVPPTHPDRIVGYARLHLLDAHHRDRPDPLPRPRRRLLPRRLPDPPPQRSRHARLAAPLPP